MKRIQRTIKRRRHQNKTDYKHRFGLLGSKKARLVIRKTNRYMVAQIVVSDIAQDRVLVTASSKELLAHGWPEAKSGSLKSLAAAYLTGRLIAKKSSDKEAIADIGMNRNIKNSRIFAVIRGAIDGGMEIPAGEEALPSDKVIERNENTREIFIKLKDKIK